MPIITSVKPQKNGRRVNIYIDDEFSFGIDLENYVKYGLKVNKELSEEEIEKIIHKSLFQKNLDNLLRFSTLRPRSQKEVRDWFKRKQVPSSLQNELFEKLKSFDLIDDSKFAQWWIDQRKAFRPKVKSILANELRIKGISKDIIEDVLSAQVIDEIGIAKKELEKKYYKWEKLPIFERKRKMSEFLARKGYKWETVKKAINALTEKE